jgi:hypothetical protein
MFEGTLGRIGDTQDAGARAESRYHASLCSIQ